MAPPSGRDLLSPSFHKHNESYGLEIEHEKKELNDIQKCKRILELLI